MTVAAFTVTPAPGLLGIQDGTDSPETGFGASAVDGTKYLFMYRSNLPAGTLRFDLTNPTSTFGFYITDVGETSGAVTFHTNAGESLSETTLAQYPPTLGNGNAQFFGITQATPFTQLFLTSTGIDDSYGLDKVYFRTVVPAPGAFAVLSLGGAAGILWLHRLSRKEQGTAK